MTSPSPVPPALGSFRRQIVVLTGCVTAFAMLVLTVVVNGRAIRRISSLASLKLVASTRLNAA